MKVCPACGKVNLDESVFCDGCAESLSRVRSVGVGEAVELEKRIELEHKTKPQRVGSRAPILVALGIGLALLIGGLEVFFVLENLVLGVFLMFTAFIVLGATTQLFKDAPYGAGRLWGFRGWSGWRLTRAQRREEDEEFRREAVDN